MYMIYDKEKIDVIAISDKPFDEDKLHYAATHHYEVKQEDISLKTLVLGYALPKWTLDDINDNAKKNNRTVLKPETEARITQIVSYISDAKIAGVSLINPETTKDEKFNALIQELNEWYDNILDKLNNPGLKDEHITEDLVNLIRQQSLILEEKLSVAAFNLYSLNRKTK